MKYNHTLHQRGLLGMGWKCFADHGNPDFDTPVWVLARIPNSDDVVVAVGLRRREVGADGKENWHCVFPNPALRGGLMLTYWAPIARPGMPYTMEHPEPETPA